MQVGATAAAAKDKLSKQMELEGMKMGVAIAKDRTQANRPQSQPPRQPPRNK
jgi:hypothetical protein